MSSEQDSAGRDETMLVLRDQFHLLGAYVPPSTATEHTLAELWCKVLTMDRIGISDRYEDLGGDSLLAASLFAEIETTFGVIIPTDSLMQAETIEQLARVIDAAAAKPRT
jgi:acyl carrier protein